MKNFLRFILPLIVLTLSAPLAQSQCEADFEFEQVDGTYIMEFFDASFSNNEIISYLWDFGDGHDGDGENPTHEYEEPGGYLVCLTIEDNEGCVDEVCHDFFLEELPGNCEANFEFELSDNSYVVEFFNTSTSDNEIISYLWDFGDGHESDGENPTHEYDGPGGYLVCLTIEDNTGCTDEQCHDFFLEEIQSNCEADFEWEQGDNNVVHFFDISFSDHDIVSYLWDFGDGHESDGENPTHEYEEPGVYVVCLIIENSEGCVSDVCHEIVVEDQSGNCEANFEFEIGDNSYVVEFFNTSTSDNEIISYHWDFGDGHESDGENPTHEYDEPGGYLVCLTIEDNTGCTDEQCHDFFLEEIQSNCEADFEWEQGDNNVVHFFDISFSDHDIVSYSWNFGDGHEGDGENPTHEYEEPGVYVVCLIITNSEGCVSDVCHEIVVEDQSGNCEANFEFEIGDNSYVVEFFNTSTSDNEIISYHWDFGDGHESDGENPTHEYDEPGGYLVCLTIEDNTGCTDEQCHDFFLEEIQSNCEADFEWEQGDNNVVHFFDISFSDHDIVSYSWNFGDGHEGDGENPTHEYEEPGVYVVCLIITNSEGCVSDICHEVVVEGDNSDCEASFEFEIGDNSYVVEFFNNSSSDNDIISYHWDFGDGNTSTEENPTHEYDGPGGYLVCLTIEDNTGCTDVQCHDFFLEEIQTGCEADFVWEQGDNFVVHFVDNSFSDHDIISYLWDFGDGHTSTEENPVHEYEEPGVYLVCLIIENAEGCMSDVCYEIVVEGEPADCHAAFEWEQSDTGLIIEFFNNSSSNNDIISYLWNFGDGHTSSEENPTHEYEEPGVYLVCLRIEDNEGCISEVCHEVVVEGEPADCHAAFEFEIGDNSLVVEFFNNSSSDNDIISYHWDFGDGHTSSEENPTHEYSEPGGYLVCLTIEDNEGCVSEVCHDFFLEGPQECEASFNFEIDDDDVVHFNNTSTGATDHTVWHWDFGDGNTSSEMNPMHEYDEEGIYTICLTMIDETTDCEDEFCLTLVYTLGLQDELPQGAQSPAASIGSINEDFILHHFTNPSSDELFVDYELREESEVLFEIYDLTGNRAVRAFVGNQLAGTQVESIDVSAIHPGIYILTMTTGKTVKTMRLSITR